MEDIADLMRRLLRPPQPADGDPLREAAAPRMPVDDGFQLPPAGFYGAWTPLDMFKERILLDLPLVLRVPGPRFHAFALDMWERMTFFERRPYWDAHFRMRQRLLYFARQQYDLLMRLVFESRLNP